MVLHWLLASVSLLSLSIWFTFKKNKFLSQIAIPLFYLGTAGLIGVLIYHAITGGSIMWNNFAAYFLKFSLFALLTLFLSNIKSLKWLNFLLVPLILVWVSPQIQKLSHKYASESGEILIHLDNEGEQDLLREVLGKRIIGLEKAFTISDTDHPLNYYYVLDLRDNRLPAGVRRISSLDFVDDFEYNEVVQVTPMPATVPIAIEGNVTTWTDDPLFEQQWGLKTLDPQALQDLLHEKSFTPANRVKIAILDTGVDGKHEDIKDAFVSTASTYDIDRIGHGTHCAGIAAAINHNGKGIASLPINEYVEVTSIKVLKRNGSGTQKDIIQGMIEAADRGAQVLSLSLGGRSSDKKQKAYELAVEYANERDAIVVVAAGNNGGDARNLAPANARGVITVAAVDQNLQRASFSNSVEFIEMGIAAPGVNILSTMPGNQYKSLNGTSMATPFVSSLVAIIKCIQPSSDTREIYDILNQNSIQTLDQKETGKLIDPVKSIGSILD